MNSEIQVIDRAVPHHFDTAEQEFEASNIGMWLFLAQEILFFSGLFVAYAVFRGLYPEMFVGAHHYLSRNLGAFNTVVLITSSFTMVMAVRSFQVNKIKQGIYNLFATFGFALIFMIVKVIEYNEKIAHGLLPAQWFGGESSYELIHLFFGLYFTMTGIHGLHIIIGMGLIIWLIRRAYRGELHAKYFTPVEMVGLYWHLVDLVWIFLFPLLYLIG